MVTCMVCFTRRYTLLKIDMEPKTPLIYHIHIQRDGEEENTAEALFGFPGGEFVPD